MKRKQTRRGFIKAGLAGLAAITLLLWDNMVGRQKVIASRKVVEVPFNEHDDVAFYEDFIIVNTDKEIKVLSSKCTHLGCQINKQVGDELLCPCHGSAFTLDGQVKKGPALRPLPEMEYKLDIAGGKIIVSV